MLLKARMGGDAHATADREVDYIALQISVSRDRFQFCGCGFWRAGISIAGPPVGNAG